MNASKNNISVNQKTLKRMNNRILTTFIYGYKITFGSYCRTSCRKCFCRARSGFTSLWMEKPKPFHSIYFAAQSMAAEMSTGVLGQLACDSVEDSIAMLVVKCEGEFFKKATDRTTFTCSQGQDFFDAIHKTVQTGEPVTVRSISEGKCPTEQLHHALYLLGVLSALRIL